MNIVIFNILSVKYKTDVHIIYYNSVFRELFINNDSINLLDTDNITETDIYVIRN